MRKLTRVGILWGLLAATKLLGQTNSGPTVRMSTTLGEVDFQLFRDAARATVETS